MPLGVPLRRYVTFMAASLLTMFAGAQTVHVYYKPLDDLDEYIEKAKRETPIMKG